MTVTQYVVIEMTARFHKVSVAVALQANFLYSLIHHHKTELKYGEVSLHAVAEEWRENYVLLMSC